MKITRIIIISAMLIAHVACAWMQPRSEKAISEAHELADAGTLVVTFTGNGTSRPGRGTLCSGLDLTVSQVGKPPDQFSLCVDNDHPDHTELAALREGEKIRFEFLDRTRQSRESKEAYVTFSRFDKKGMKL